MRPYKIALCLLIFQLIEVFGLLILTEVIYTTYWMEFVAKLDKDKVIQYFLDGCGAFKYSLLTIFMLARTFEHESLLFFVYF